MMRAHEFIRKLESLKDKKQDIIFTCSHNRYCFSGVSKKEDGINVLLAGLDRPENATYIHTYLEDVSDICQNVPPINICDLIRYLARIKNTKDDLIFTCCHNRYRFSHFENTSEGLNVHITSIDRPEKLVN